MAQLDGAVDDEENNSHATPNIAIQIKLPAHGHLPDRLIPVHVPAFIVQGIKKKHAQ